MINKGGLTLLKGRCSELRPHLAGLREARKLLVLDVAPEKRDREELLVALLPLLVDVLLRVVALIKEKQNKNSNDSVIRLEFFK